MTDIENGAADSARDHIFRRGVILAGSLLAGASLASGASAREIRTESQPRSLNGAPVRPGRGSQLTGKVAVVTGAARGIGRAGPAGRHFTCSGVPCLRRGGDGDGGGV